jgi:hypothetical protein
MHTVPWPISTPVLRERGRILARVIDLPKTSHSYWHLPHAMGVSKLPIPICHIKFPTTYAKEIDIRKIFNTVLNIFPNPSTQ